MNYLAHTLLSHNSPEDILGAMLGDFVKGPLDTRYAPVVREAILLHRAIDRYTDAHPVALASRLLVSAPRRRFAPILVDVFYDHFLARHWDDYCELPLAQFAAHVYDVLLTHRAELPERLQWVAPHMAADNWLMAYAGLEGIDAAVNGIARRMQRFPRAAVLHGGVEELQNNYDAFEHDFRRFFPQLMQQAVVSRSHTRAAAA
jgi:acyl carrier protein phosphodiesterase